MNDMFYGATAFNGDLPDWEVVQVEDNLEMFGGSNEILQPEYTVLRLGTQGGAGAVGAPDSWRTCEP